MWLDDVLPQATIRSVWGNSVRDRIVQTFDTLAEANAHVFGLPEGATCYVAETATMYVRRGGSWRANAPKIVYGTNAPDTTLPVDGVAQNIVTLNVPPGYRQALFTWRLYATALQTGLDYSLLCNLYVDGGATNIAIANFVGLTDGHGRSHSPATFELTAAWDISQAGTGCQGTVINKNTGSGVSGPVGLSGNNFYARLMAVLMP